jgi:hypothetical protein
MAVSVEIKFFVFVINGINESRLISKPIHIPNHEEEEIEIIDPAIRVIKNNNLNE